MPKIYALFFTLYTALWKLVFPFLRRNKRLKEGFSQRQIPDDWLTQDLLYVNTLAYEKNPDKPFFGDIKKTNLLPLNTTTSVSLANTSTTNVSIPNPSTTDIWIQAASGGEAYLACELIKTIAKNNTNLHFLITTWTRQGMQILVQECEKLMQEFFKENAPFIQIRFAPLDTKACMEKAISLAKPKLCVMLETELWPFFMLTCKQKNIPFYVVNGRMSKSTFELYKIIAPVLNYVAPKQILAVTKEEMQRFFHIFPSSLVSFMPNIKFDTAAQLVRTNYTKLLEDLSQEEIRQEEMRIKKLALQKEAKANSTKEKVHSQISIEKQNNFIFDNQDSNIILLPSTTQSNTQNESTIKSEAIHKQEVGGENTIKKTEEIETIETIEETEEEFYCEQNTKKTSLLDRKTYLPVLPMLFSKAQKSFLFASIRQEEENFFAALIWKIYPQRKKDIFIIAPRHMHRVTQWRRRFYDLGMQYALASEIFHNKDFSKGETYFFKPHTCIIWDIFGDLPHLYAHTDMAIVGGSFKNLGGQNFLEAIACGTKVHTGSYIDNFLWALGQEDCNTLSQTLEKNINISQNATQEKILLSMIPRVKKAQNTTQSLIDIGLLRMHSTKKSLEEAILSQNACKKTAHERLEIQKQFHIWIENRCGGTELASNKILEVL